MPTTSNFPFSAVLLAGGRSTRMGRDKASLEIEGESLWHRQLVKLRALNPAELFISGHAEGPYKEAGIEIVRDIHKCAGPMGGLAACLERASNELIVVLAIDLPALPIGFLRKLVTAAECSRTCVVPQWESENYEPLAAIYHRGILSTVNDYLSESRFSIQQLIKSLVDRSLALPCAIAPDEKQFFINVNTPSELAAYVRSDNPAGR